MNYSQGKSFLAPRKLFKADKALYFPNMRGYTLENAREVRDTSRVLAGSVSVVTVYSGTWAERQCRTFFAGPRGEELQRLMKEARVQKVDINIEEDWMKAGLIRLFLPNTRKNLEREVWGRYFVVRRGVGEEMRQQLGIANGKVGYVYLVDESWKIRWAGSGVAEEGEREGLLAGVKRLTGRVMAGGKGLPIAAVR